MEFRFVALIALWTLLSGPMFGTPSASPPAPAEHTAPVVKKVDGRTSQPGLPSPRK
jgi:hypothetical protein